MKSYFLPIVLLLTVLGIESCSQDKAALPTTIDCTGVDAATNTYNLAIKPVLDFHCAYSGCHDAASNSSNVNLEGYAAAKNSFETKDALCTVKHESGCSPMPQAAPKLADSLITRIQCWAENGYPQ
ncbi:MAG: hypothetical protein IPH78_04855 [Bacteroidetes bacterium]|nr:hypothetical protein [Bacteroidota bacterium]MBK8658602.1 hypothetical protein [Bacteroidota bacterium]